MAILNDIPSFVAANKGAVFLYGFIIYLAISAAASIRTWYSLRKFKGPLWAAFSKWWLLRHVVITGTWHLDAYEITKKYGSVARIGPEQLLTSDPEVIRRYLGPRSPYTRSDWYMCTRFDPERDNIESTRSEERHAWLRSRMAPGYTGKEVAGLEQTVNDSIMSLVNLVETKYITTDTEYKPMDFAQKALFFTIDTITALAFGEPFGCLTNNSDMHDYMHVTETMLPFTMMISVYPWLNRFLQLRIVKSLLPSEADPVGVGKIKAFVTQVPLYAAICMTNAIGSITKVKAAERFGPNKKIVPDMVGSFIKHGLTQEDIESETIIQLAAGTDTTAVAIRATFLYLITNPRILSRLRAEIATISLPYPDSTATPISNQQALAMPYLQAVIKEGLRLYPPITALLAKQVPEGGDVIHGVHVPGGTRIGWCVWGMMRDKDLFGEDAEVFRPERWLANEAGKQEGEGWKMNMKAAEDVVGMVFSYGRHSCLGKNVAMLELNKIFVELFRRFDFTIVNPNKPWDVRSVGVFHQKNLWVRVTRREPEVV